jgi:hypothetical protein
MSPLLTHRVDADSSSQWLIPDSKCPTAKLAQERRRDLLPLAAVQGLPESEKNRYAQRRISRGNSTLIRLSSPPAKNI